MSLSAKGDANVKPAPPIEVGPIGEEGVDEEEDNGFVQQPDELGGAEDWLDWQQIKAQRHTEL